jgi:hypothetical protein
VYGVAAYNRWKVGQETHYIMKNYRTEHYENIPALPQSSSDSEDTPSNGNNNNNNDPDFIPSSSSEEQEDTQGTEVVAMPALSADSSKPWFVWLRRHVFPSILAGAIPRLHLIPCDILRLVAASIQFLFIVMAKSVIFSI